MTPNKLHICQLEHLNWCKYDFEVNKHYWIKQGVYKAQGIRMRNLTDIKIVFEKNQFKYCLIGKTLVSAVMFKKLQDDHDDDVGIFEEDLDLFQRVILPELFRKDFYVVRDTPGIISILRDHRYIDICILRKKKNIIYYNKKSFPIKFFKNFDTVYLEDQKFISPCNPKKLINIIYNQKASFIFLKTILNNILKPSSYKKLYKKCALNLFNKLWHVSPSTTLWNVFLWLAGYKVEKLTCVQFKKLMIEPEDSFNWKWRKPHLDLVTNHAKYKCINQIIDYMKKNGVLRHLKNEIVETKTDIPFYEPHNYDKTFWQSGNNYFIYCILYKFKNNVVPYDDANSYIKSNKQPYLYTSKYYESLSDMNDTEIEVMLKNKPIEVYNHAITSGKHRAFAMIGRLTSSEDYIPFYTLRNSKIKN
jgi:hypothetical protein